MMNTKDAKQRIKELVDNYTKLVEEKTIRGYNEEMTKKDFILPLFEALGWNVYNKPNKTDNVSAEETISKKRVDYGFRINGIPKFLLEAKAIPVDLNKTKFAEQAINYSWHNGCTWAVLTDFEGIKVFNAEWKSRNVSENLFLDLNWRDYLDHFDKLWLLSKESFEKGLLDKEAELYGKKSKKIPVAKQLLTDFTRFREMLSKDITTLNPDKGLTEEELDESVQRILDRLIFIRNCEDRELEARKLMPALRDWESRGRKGQLLKQLRAIFNYFDGQYNSKLFQEHLCDSLEISDNVLNEVVYGLYQTKDKTVYYDFSAIEADVLGNIYEQYLGHILRKTAKRAKVTESHARRKEHGIYYTPPYIVDYIVRNTLGELLKRSSPNEIEKIRVLDPACGSGSFLIKSFDILNEYWKEKDKDYAQAQLDTTGQGTTFTRKTKILQNNIFGVDLDKQAVEIAQLNLLLKIAEKGHRLPLLQQNITCGNSLIDDPTVAGDKYFKWEEKFEVILNEGGFDVVIGNPPYVRPHKMDKKDKEFFWKNLKTFKAKSDLYSCFMEKGINLLREGGLFSFIVPHTWTSLESFYEIRKYILENCKVLKLVRLPKKVFQDATVETTIFILAKEPNKKNRDNNKIVVDALNEKGDITFVKKFTQSQITNNYSYNFELYTEEYANKILYKVKQTGERLGNLIDFVYGLKTGDDQKFLFDEPKNNECKKLLRSKDIGRYFKEFKGKYVWYVPNLMIRNKKTARPGSKERFKTEKIVVARMGKRVVATYDDEEYYVKDAMLLLKKSEESDLKYITAILNSKLINYYYKNYFITIDVLKNALLELPIASADRNTTANISEKVKKIEELNKRLNEMGDKKTDERARIEEEIKKTDKEIDELVYKLYGITEEEKEIIEGSLK
jgi:type I restriction-modification system DNA methylase subunit